jgi:hypothetical protein
MQKYAEMDLVEVDIPEKEVDTSEKEEGGRRKNFLARAWNKICKNAASKCCYASKDASTDASKKNPSKKNLLVRAWNKICKNVMCCCKGKASKEDGFSEEDKAPMSCSNGVVSKADSFLEEEEEKAPASCSNRDVSNADGFSEEEKASMSCSNGVVSKDNGCSKKKEKGKEGKIFCCTGHCCCNFDLLITSKHKFKKVGGKILQELTSTVSDTCEIRTIKELEVSRFINQDKVMETTVRDQFGGVNTIKTSLGPSKQKAFNEEWEALWKKKEEV